MSSDGAYANHGLTIESIQPIVLVGGASRRYGRDKLREPWRGRPLVQAPIDHLRGVFGSCVKLVGRCAPDIAALADGIIPDAHPGTGPIGGIVSALEHGGGAVFVLAGDMPLFGPDEILAVVHAARLHPRCAAWATNTHPHPCAALYFPDALPRLKTRLVNGEYQLRSALPHDQVAMVHIAERATANINLPEDLVLHAPPLEP